MRSTINNNPEKTEWMGQVTWSDRCKIDADGPETTIKNLTKEGCAIKCLAKQDCIFFNWYRDSNGETTSASICQILSAVPLSEIAYYKTIPDLMCGFIMARLQVMIKTNY